MSRVGQKQLLGSSSGHRRKAVAGVKASHCWVKFKDLCTGRKRGATGQLAAGRPGDRPCLTHHTHHRALHALSFQLPSATWSPLTKNSNAIPSHLLAWDPSILFSKATLISNGMFIISPLHDRISASQIIWSYVLIVGSENMLNEPF